MIEEHKLDGCGVSPISNYLKGLGISRILSSKDPDSTSFWKGDKFVLQTHMGRDDVIRFLLEEYRPTPIVSPWSYTVYQKSRDLVLKLFEHDKRRFGAYWDTVCTVDNIIADMKSICEVSEITKKEIDANKEMLLCMCRNRLSDDAILWIDAVGTVAVDKAQTKAKFAPILGSGGNDGNFDMAKNFVINIDRMLISKNNNQEKSRNLLNASLFAEMAPLSNITTMGHNPSGSGGPNFGSGFDGKTLSNPWDYIFMVEGALLCAGSVSKHLSANRGTAVFPFTASTSTIGYSTASPEDTDEGGEPISRGEIWMPIWERPTTHAEIVHTFTEGRIQLGRKNAKTGTEFAQAVITLGTDRGIEKFQRYCILKRKGKAYLAVNAGAVHVRDKPVAKLLRETDIWYNYLLGKSREKGAPASLIRLVRDLEMHIMKFCTSPTEPNLMQVLISMGHLEKYASLSGTTTPLSSLSKEWLTGCYDGSAEFRLASSIASIQKNTSLPIRENLEDIDSHKRKFEKSLSCVWNTNDTTLRNMERVLLRRILDGNMKSFDKMPLYGYIPAETQDVALFLHGRLNLKKIGELVLPLSFIDMTKGVDYPWINQRNGNTIPLPESYMLLNLIYPPYPEHNIPHDTSILNLLQAGRFLEAYDKCVHVLRAHGLPPRTDHKTTRSGFRTIPETVRKHLMASLLFPISDADRKSMIKSTVGNLESMVHGI